MLQAEQMSPVPADYSELQLRSVASLSITHAGITIKIGINEARDGASVHISMEHLHTYNKCGNPVTLPVRRADLL
jgi:hypothetical protein